MTGRPDTRPQLRAAASDGERARAPPRTSQVNIHMNKKPLGDHSDAELMGQVQAGDQQAFAALYTRHRRVAFALAARMCGGGAADDVVQLAFLTAWRARAGYDDERGSPRGWLLAIVRNRAIDAQRRDGSYQRLLRAQEQALSHGAPAVARDQPDLLALEREQTRATVDALALLPEPQRRVLELAYFQGLTHQQIAAREAAPLGTVKSRLRLGLEKLHEHLDDGSGLAPGRPGMTAADPI